MVQQTIEWHNSGSKMHSNVDCECEWTLKYSGDECQYVYNGQMAISAHYEFC